VAIRPWLAWLEDLLGVEREQFEPPLSYIEAVDRARREWLAARAYFETVAEPELVDHAIYLVDAAERKYVYLLRAAREAGVVATLTGAGRGIDRDIRRASQA